MSFPPTTGDDAGRSGGPLADGPSVIRVVLDAVRAAPVKTRRAMLGGLFVILLAIGMSVADLVNLDHLSRFEPDPDGSALLVLSDGTRVRVSRRRAGDVRRRLEV